MGICANILRLSAFMRDAESAQCFVRSAMKKFLQVSMLFVRTNSKSLSMMMLLVLYLDCPKTWPKVSWDNYLELLREEYHLLASYEINNCEPHSHCQ